MELGKQYFLEDTTSVSEKECVAYCFNEGQANVTRAVAKSSGSVSRWIKQEGVRWRRESQRLVPSASMTLIWNELCLTVYEEEN